MYSCFTRMNRCYSYVTCMYSYVTRMYSCGVLVFILYGSLIVFVEPSREGEGGIIRIAPKIWGFT